MLQDVSSTYYSARFTISLNFAPSGAITGTIAHEAYGVVTKIDLEGIWLLENDMIKLVLTSSSANDNPLFRVLTCYHGVVVSYEGNKKCIALKWLRSDELAPNLECQVECDSEVLFGWRPSDFIVETRKALAQTSLEHLIGQTSKNFLQ